MPDGIYLDALALGPERLAQKMSEIISNQDHYYEMFRWRRYYSYHSPDEHPDSDAVCIFCAYLNKVRNIQFFTMYSDIVAWRNECKHRPQVLQAPEKRLENKIKNDSSLADELYGYYVW